MLQQKHRRKAVNLQPSFAPIICFTCSSCFCLRQVPVWFMLLNNGHHGCPFSVGWLIEGSWKKQSVGTSKWQVNIYIYNMNKWYIISGMVYQTNPSIFFKRTTYWWPALEFSTIATCDVLSVTGRGTSGLANMLLETVSGPQRYIEAIFFATLLIGLL